MKCFLDFLSLFSVFFLNFPARRTVKNGAILASQQGDFDAVSACLWSIKKQRELLPGGILKRSDAPGNMKTWQNAPMSSTMRLLGTIQVPWSASQKSALLRTRRLLLASYCCSRYLAFFDCHLWAAAPALLLSSLALAFDRVGMACHVQYMYVDTLAKDFQLKGLDKRNACMQVISMHSE